MSGAKGGPENGPSGGWKSGPKSAPKSAPKSQPAIFLDRDGTINRELGEYLTDIAQVEILPGSAEAMRRAEAAGFKLVVVTNQGGVGRGFLSEEKLQAINVYIEQSLARLEAHLDAFYYCPHHSKADNPAYRRDCPYRKPHPGMLVQAAQDLSIDLKRSFIVGDQLRDIGAGTEAGCKTVLVLTGFGREELGQADDDLPDHVAEDVLDAVEWIIEQAGVV